MRGIVWLASYPKSGNTWLRVLLSNYLRDDDRPADINDLEVSGLGTSRPLLDEWLGLESADLRLEEVEHYRPIVYTQMAQSSPDRIFVKVHDAYTRNGESRPLFPRDATAGVIYAIRNPLDVAVSFAHHEDLPVETIIERMASDDYVMSFEAGRMYSQVPARLSTWSGHATSWLDEADAELRRLVVRFEDLTADPAGTFGRVVRFLSLEEDDDRIRRAVEFSRFERLREQETAHGFRERQTTSPSFFREGRVGSWRDTLTPSQVERLVADHRLAMRRFGYLTDDDEIVC